MYGTVYKMVCTFCFHCTMCRILTLLIYARWCAHFVVVVRYPSVHKTYFIPGQYITHASARIVYPSKLSTLTYQHQATTCPSKQQHFWLPYTCTIAGSTTKLNVKLPQLPQRPREMWLWNKHWFALAGNAELRTVHGVSCTVKCPGGLHNRSTRPAKQPAHTHCMTASQYNRLA